MIYPLLLWAHIIGASVLPWRSTDAGTPERALWSSGAAVTAGAVLVVVAGVAATALLRLRPRRSVATSLGALAATLAGAVGGALLVADRLPGIHPGESPYRLLLLRETTPPLELFAAVVAVLGGTTLVVGAALVLLAAATAPDREPVDATV